MKAPTRCKDTPDLFGPTVGDSNCQLCKLHKSAHTICMGGKGPAKTEVMIVLDTPSRKEDETGRHFQGRVRELLQEELNENGINDAYFTFAVSCRPPEEKSPSKGEIKSCKVWLDAQIQAVGPKYVLLLGNVPLQSITGSGGIKKRRGKPFEQGGIIYVPAYHPAFILRDPTQRDTFQRDIKLFADIIKGGGMPREKELNAVTVTTHDHVATMIEDLTGEVSFDIETSCLYPWQKYNDKGLLDPAIIKRIGFGTKNAEYSVVMDAFSKREQQEIVDKITECLEDCSLVVHNGKFDFLWMWVHFNVRWHEFPYFDTMLAHYLLDENDRHGLKYLAQKYLGAPDWDVDQDTKTGKGSVEKLTIYHAHDLYYTRKLRTKFGKMLREDVGVARVFYKLMMPVSRLFVEVEYDGIYVDESKYDIASMYLHEEYEKAKKELATYSSINWASVDELRKLLFTSKKEGGLGLKALDKTKASAKHPQGRASTSESVLKRLDHPCVGALLKFREVKQQLSFFIEGWKPFFHRQDTGVYLHPSFKLHGAVTGRPSCVREGTSVMVPGGTKNIEDIRVGDWVYSYDKDLKLVLRRVTWSGRTGYKKCLRVYWSGRGGQHEGHLDVTEDHRIRLTSGSYVEARHLRGGKYIRWRDRYHQGEHVLALHRSSNHRNFLYATGHQGKLREARIVFESVYGWRPEHVHHVDGNPLNDSPSNLRGLTHEEHTSLHASNVTSEEMRRRANKRTPETKKRNAKAISEASKERAERRFTRDQVQKAIDGCGGILAAKEELGCSYDAIRRRIDQWGLRVPHNHMITRIEEIGSHSVFDLSVDETHNFIANEICVHNCEHPNLQQVPRDERIRSLITAPPGWTLIDADLSQIELRIAAFLAREKELMRVFIEGGDPHWLTCIRELGRGMAEPQLVVNTAWKFLQRSHAKAQKPRYAAALDIVYEMGADVAVEIDKRWKEFRKKAKAVNFGFLYGMWWKKFKIYARDNYGVVVTDEQAEAAREAFFELYSGFPKWHNKQKMFARRNGYVRTLSGRKRRLPNAMLPEDSPLRGAAERQAVNSPVQGFAAELNLMIALQIRREFKRSQVRIVGTVHDSILMWVKNGLEERVTKRVQEITRKPDLFEEFSIEVDIPIEGDAALGAWGAGKNLKKWLEANNVQGKSIKNKDVAKVSRGVPSKIRREATTH